MACSAKAIILSFDPNHLAHQYCMACQWPS